jgi:hypothetical protein
VEKLMREDFFAMNDELKKAIADLRSAFRNSGLESLWLTISAEGAIVGTLDAHGKAQSVALPTTHAESNNAGAKSQP